MTRALVPLIMLLATACQAAEAPDRHVVVISIDGLPASYLDDPQASLPAALCGGRSSPDGASYLDDPQASLPVIRGLIRAGVVASGGMRVSNPSVTWPNHTNLMTGVRPERHGVLVNGLPERQGPGRPVRVTPGKDRRDLVLVPPPSERLREAGRTSAVFHGPCLHLKLPPGMGRRRPCRRPEARTPRLRP